MDDQSLSLSEEELRQIRKRDLLTDPKWFEPSLVLAPHNTCYADRHKLLEHIATLERQLGK